MGNVTADARVAIVSVLFFFWPRRRVSHRSRAGKPYVFHAATASSAAGRGGSFEGMRSIITYRKKTGFLLLGLVIILVFPFFFTPLLLIAYSLCPVSLVARNPCL